MRRVGIVMVTGLCLFGCESSQAPSDAALTEDAGRDAGFASYAGADADAGLIPDTGACTPACVDRACGDDGCGGTCGSCDPGARCTAQGQCEETPLCENGRLDPGETRIDCGGPCPACPPRSCTRDRDSAFVPAGYDCVWNDEFGGAAGQGQGPSAVNDVNWTFQNLDVNGEAQNYTNRQCTEPEHDDDWNYCVQDGLLTIRARDDGMDCTDGPDPDDQPDNPDCALDWGQARGATAFTSGRIISKHKAAFRYGYLEFRARLPHHDRGTPQSGFWPAIWLLGDDISEGPPPGDNPWPGCGEIDVLEWRSPGNHMGYNAIWTDANGGYASCAGGAPECGPCNGPCTGTRDLGDRYQWVSWPDFPHQDFHVYGFLWTAEQMQVLIDGEVVSALRLSDAQSEFKERMFMIVNLAIGGSLGGAIEITDWDTATFEVDYLRWYQPLD